MVNRNGSPVINFTLPALLLFTLVLHAQPPQGYYTPAEELTGYELKTALSLIITNGHVSQGYNALWDAYATTDRDYYYEDDGTILDIYSENPDGPDSYTYTLATDQCGNYDGEGSCYNREHLMPQSWFNRQSPMKDDIQAVYPTDGYVNGQRGHLPFGEVLSATWISYNGSKKGNNSFDHPQAYKGEVFEPIDEFKGDIARVYFYMATRYESQIAGWENVNVGSQNTLNGTSDQVFDDWMLDMLLQWHRSDPVSQKEIDRNNAAYAFQGNRNPFIDNPAYVIHIWQPGPDTQAPSPPENLRASNIIHHSLLLAWDAASDNVAVTGYEIEVDGEIVNTTSDTTFPLTGLMPETGYRIVVYALDAAGNRSEGSRPLLVNTTYEAAVILSENFEDCSTVAGSFVAVSEESYLDWQCIDAYGEGNSGAMQMNGYDGGQVASKDWLITAEKIDFDAFEEEKLSFFAASTFGSTRLELLYSVDYDGGTNPSAFSWQPVPNVSVPLHWQGSQNTDTREQLFTNIDVSSITGEVWLAFKYDTSDGQLATRWTVDSFQLTGRETASSVNGVLDNSLIIYPNPVIHGKLMIATDAGRAFRYIIFDLNQRPVLRGRVADGSTAIDVQTLRTGTYLLMIESKEYRATGKFVILP